jgi:hypothetical protein
VGLPRESRTSLDFIFRISDINYFPRDHII